MKLDPRMETLAVTTHLSALSLALAPPLVFAAVVAPAVARILPTRDLMGALQSPILTKLSVLAQGSFGVLFLTSWLLTSRDTARASRALLTRLPVVGFFAALVIQQLLIPPMDKIRAEAPGLIDTLPAEDPGRILLDRYHRFAVGLFALQIGAALLILLVTARLLSERRTAPPLPGQARAREPRILDL